jgi:hypothetical protein
VHAQGYDPAQSDETVKSYSAVIGLSALRLEQSPFAPQIPSDKAGFYKSTCSVLDVVLNIMGIKSIVI